MALAQMPSAPGPTSTRRFPCLEPALQGPSTIFGARPERTPTNPSLVPLYEQRIAVVISTPTRASNLWFPVESIRLEVPTRTARYHRPRRRPLLTRLVAEDLWRSAAIEVGVPAADMSQRFLAGQGNFF